MIKKIIIYILAVSCLSAGGCRKDNAKNPPVVAVTNSYLAAAVQDLLGKAEPVLTLAKPGMCPGHFDIRPSQVNALGSCRIFLRFDFQKGLESKLSRLRKNGLEFFEIRVPGGLCQPPSYLSTCRQIAKVLVDTGLLTHQQADKRLKEINQRIDKKQAWARRQLSGLGDADIPVIASIRQEAFCGWLGLKVVATFRGADVESVSQIDRAVQQGRAAGVKLVIANLPQGRRVADALAQRLGAKVVVFRNFPAIGKPGFAFDELLEKNIAELLRGMSR